MSSFPDVLSAELSYQADNPTNKPTFTVPAEYAFAVVQVCLIPDLSGVTGLIINTNHGIFSFDGYTGAVNNTNEFTLKDLPILNFIIKGGEAFSLTGHLRTDGSGFNGQTKAKVTALCHKKPS